MLWSSRRSLLNFILNNCSPESAIFRVKYIKKQRNNSQQNSSTQIWRLFLSEALLCLIKNSRAAVMLHQPSDKYFCFGEIFLMKWSQYIIIVIRVSLNHLETKYLSFLSYLILFNFCQQSRAVDQMFFIARIIADLVKFKYPHWIKTKLFHCLLLLLSAAAKFCFPILIVNPNNKMKSTVYLLHCGGT